MAITFDTKYPADLTNAAWQKEKNKLDKAVSKTGLGDKLAAAEREWKKIKFDMLNVKKLKPIDGMDFYSSTKQHRDTAQQHVAGEVKNAYEALMAASRKARDTAKLKLLSKHATAAANLLSNNLQKQAVKLKSIKLDDFDTEIAELKKAVDAQDGIYNDGVQKVNQALRTLASNRTFAGWEKAGLLNRTSFVRSQVLSAIQVGRPDFRPLKAPWVSITQKTTAAEKVIKGTDAAADTKVIDQYIKEVQALVGQAKL
jgi:hypothetical protein